MTVGRGLPGGKSLSFVSPKESNPRKGDPAHPRNPGNRACRAGGKELAPLCIYQGQRGSDSFAADPPARLNSRRVYKGKKVKTRTVMTGRFMCLAGGEPNTMASRRSARPRSRWWLYAKLVLLFVPSQPRRQSGPTDGSAAKLFEPRLQKSKLNTTRRGEFFAARSSGRIVGNSGMPGSPFLGLLSFGETKESD